MLLRPVTPCGSRSPSTKTIGSMWTTKRCSSCRRATVLSLNAAAQKNHHNSPTAQSACLNTLSTQQHLIVPLLLLLLWDQLQS